MSHRHPARLRTRVLGGAFAALTVVGGAVAVTAQGAPADVRLAQNATEQNATGQTGGEQSGTEQSGTGQKSSAMEVGRPVSLDLQPIVAKAAGGTVPPGASLQVTGLPDGLTQKGWVISGTPERAGTYHVQVTITVGGHAESRKVTLEVVEPGAATTGGQATEGATTTAKAAGGETAGGATTTAKAPGDKTTGGKAAGDKATEGGATGSGEIVTSGTTTAAAGPDLCAALSGGTVDGSALALALAPLLGEQGQNPLVQGVLGVVAQILPTVLGGNAGSLGTIACAIAPSGGTQGTSVPTTPSTSGAGTTTTAAEPAAGADAATDPAGEPAAESAVPVAGDVARR